MIAPRVLKQKLETFFQKQVNVEFSDNDKYNFKIEGEDIVIEINDATISIENKKKGNDTS